MKRRAFLAGSLLVSACGLSSAAFAQQAPAGELQVRKTKVGELPVLVVAPKETRGRHLVLWFPGFSGGKDSTEGFLRRLAGEGYVAVSFDAYQHGERMIETRQELVDRVRGNIRRYFWPILAQTAEEVPQVIDWAVRELGVRPEVGIGGTSMGGDISVAAAGVDSRIKAVSAIVATPEWLRPGSFEPHGAPDEIAQKAYDRRNPLTHLENYRHRPAIAFQSGERDLQVPVEAGERFVAQLKSGIYKGAEDRLVVNIYPGMSHGLAPGMLDASVEWFKKWLK